MENPEIWHQRMPYYAELISNKTRGVTRDIWGFIDGTIHKTTRPLYTTNGPCIPDPKNVMA